MCPKQNGKPSLILSHTCWQVWTEAFSSHARNPSFALKHYCQIGTDPVTFIKREWQGKLGFSFKFHFNVRAKWKKQNKTKGSYLQACTFESLSVWFLLRKSWLLSSVQRAIQGLKVMPGSMALHRDLDKVSRTHVRPIPKKWFTNNVPENRIFKPTKTCNVT